MILQPSYLHNGISFTGKMTSLCWILAQVFFWMNSTPCMQKHGYEKVRIIATIDTWNQLKVI